MSENTGPAIDSSQRSTPAEIAALNGRIDRLPAWGLSRVVFLVLGLSYVFVFYDITAYGVALPTLLDDLNLPESASGPPLTANLVAYIVGAYGLGTLADYAGRRLALVISISLITVGGVLTALSWDVGSLTAFRAVTGLGMGAQISLASTFVGEFASASSRSRWINRTTAIGPVGLIAPAFIGIALLPVPHVGWRVLFGLGATSIVLLWFCRKRWLPESPRWLVLHGHKAEAERVVTGMERTAQHRTGKPLPPVPELPDEVPVKGFPTLQLLSRAYLPRVLTVFGYWLFFYLADYGYVGYEPTLLGKLGVSLPEGLVYSGLSYVGFLIGGILALLLADRVERKTVILCALGVAAIGFVVIALDHTAPGAIIGGLLAGIGQYGASSAAYVYTPELFPTRARATGMAMGDGLGHVGGALAPLLVLPVLNTFGAEAAFGSFAVVVAVAGLIITVGGRRTRGRGLTTVAR